MKKIFLVLQVMLIIFATSLLFPKISSADSGCVTLIYADCSVAGDGRTYLCVNPDPNLSDFCCANKTECDNLLNPPPPTTPLPGTTCNSLGGNCLPHCNPNVYEENKGTLNCLPNSNNDPTTCCVVTNTGGNPTTVGLKCDGNKGILTAIGCLHVLDTPEAFLGDILRWAVGIGGGIAFLLILYAGFMVMTSAGNPERLKAGQELLTSAISGLILLIFSVFILKFIGIDILKLCNFGFGTCQ